MPVSYQPFFRVTGASTWIPFGNLPIASLSVAITGLSSTTSYQFEVVASNAFGSATSAVVTASTTTASGGAPPGSMAGSQTSGSVDPIITGPASGTVLTNGTLLITGITISDAVAVSSTMPAPNRATPGFGTATDGAGNVYSLDAGKNFIENGIVNGNGANTSVIQVYNGLVYAQDANTGSWYTFDQSNFNATSTVPPETVANTALNTLTVTTTTGTVAMIVNSVVLPGSNTASMTYVDTLSNTQSAAASLSLHAPGVVTSLNVKLSFFDRTGATNSITIPISVVAPVIPAPATGLTVA